MTSKFNIDNRELLQRINCGEAVVGIDFGNLIVRELAAFRLAAMDSEPVAWRWRSGPDRRWHLASSGDLAGEVEPLYRHAQPATVKEREPIAWLNDAYLARGVVDGEAGSEDAGPGYIPVYREAGPQPAPVVPEKCPAEIRDLIASHSDALFNDDDAQEIWNACRAAMLNGGKP